MLQSLSQGKDFLNLFSYTGTASVYAAIGGAKSITNVDISNTYMKWSMRNMFINNCTNLQCNYIQSDCLKWIKNTHKTFNLIFINPPTFSNSKKMTHSFELKRDYISLMINLKRILRNNGEIIFSSSTRNFQINFDDLNKIKLYAKNITKKTQSKDYLNTKNIYHSWLIKHIQ